MKDKDSPPSLDDLDDRLRKAQARRPGAKSSSDEASRGSALSVAFRIGAELVSALIVGVGIGLLLDSWLDTKPWFFLLFFVLGAAAGILNVFRAMGGYGYAAGYQKPEAAAKPADRAEERRDQSDPQDRDDRGA